MNILNSDFINFAKKNDIASIKKELNNTSQEEIDRFVISTFKQLKNTDHSNDGLKLKLWFLISKDNKKNKKIQKSINQLDPLQIKPEVKKEAFKIIFSDPLEHWRLHDLNLKIEANEENVTRLFEAIQEDDLTALEFLARHGLNMAVRNQSGDTPLLYALLNEVPNVETIKFLINEGAPLSDTYEGNNPLHFAQDSPIELVKCLVEGGTPIDAQNNQGYTPLHAAVNASNGDMVEYLAKMGAKLEIQDNMGNTPLHRAILQRRPNLDIIRCLIAHGANVDAINQSGATCAYLARSLGIDVAMDSKMESYNQEYERRKVLANLWGIETTSTLKGHTFDLARHWGRGMDATLELFKKFAEHPNQTFNLNDFLKFYEKSFGYSQLPADKIEEIFKAGETLIFESGWRGHQIIIIFHKNYMILVNRGESPSPETLHIFLIDRSKGLNPELIRKLQTELSNAKKGAKFFYQTLPEKLGFDEKRDDLISTLFRHHCTLKGQKHPNCWQVSPKAGLFALLVMESIEGLDEIDKEDRKVFAQEVKDRFNIPQAVYKQFSEFSRIIKLLEYIEDPDESCPKDLELVKNIKKKIVSKKWKHLFEREKIGPLTIQYWLELLSPSDQQTEPITYLKPMYSKKQILAKIHRFLDYEKK